MTDALPFGLTLDEYLAANDMPATRPDLAEPWAQSKVAFLTACYQAEIDGIDIWSGKPKSEAPQLGVGYLPSCLFGHGERREY